MSANETTGESVTTESSTSPTNVKAVEVNGLALFNRKGEPNSLSVCWKRWERGFERSNQRRSESNVVVALGRHRSTRNLLHSGTCGSRCIT